MSNMTLSALAHSSLDRPGLEGIDPVVYLRLDKPGISQDTTVGMLPTHQFCVHESQLTNRIDKELRANPSLPGVIVVNEKGILGVISRRKFYEVLGRRYGVALYMNKPIQIMLETAGVETLIVSKHASIGDTVTLALQRPPELIYEPLLIHDPYQNFQLLDVYTLLLAQSKLFAKLQNELQAINWELEKRVEMRTSELKSRLTYEQALAYCANALLSAEDVEGIIPETLHHLLVAAEVSWVFLGENIEDHPVGPAIQLLYQVSAFDISPISPEYRLFPHSILGKWTQMLNLGQVVIGQVDEVDASYRWIFQQLGIVSVLLLPYGEPGHWEGVIGFSENMTKRAWDENDIRLLQTVAQMIHAYLVRRRGAQELAKTRDEALHASQFKSELLAKVSHELRTPLSAILGYAQLLQFGSYGALSERQKDATQLVIGSTKYLATLVNSLLDQAQLESGQIQIHYAPFKVKNMIEEVKARIQVLAEEKGLEFRVNLAQDVPIQLIGDETRLQQIITNLLGNAIKFTERGTITLCVALDGAGDWIFQVSDTGSGIPFDAHEKIFEPFRQADGSPTRKYTGTGLGLSIASQLVQLMNGIILVDSEPGCGSTFTVRLPILTMLET